FVAIRSNFYIITYHFIVVNFYEQTFLFCIKRKFLFVLATFINVSPLFVEVNFFLKLLTNFFNEASFYST
ncbi:hypothetical protein, partial [Bacillus sp. Au-Bac7]|uniref:hypothetical protein n=1 Tax=Bacillus sp. Au-Bac7 TaxID=2906458 RepID=UPI001E2D8AF6